MVAVGDNRELDARGREHLLGPQHENSTPTLGGDQKENMKGEGWGRGDREGKMEEVHLDQS
jgi:hypothetical protein